VYGTGSGSITGGSQTSYVWGRLGRGWASSAGANNKIFPIGDSLKYRPLWLSDVTSPYHLSIVELVSGNANTGTSVLNGGIDKVSAGRYYKVWSGLIPRSGTVYQQFGLAGAGIGYYADDGVAAGNSNLRIAVSAVNGRGTWTGYGPTTHTTTFSDPTQMVSDVITPTVMMDTGSVFYVALARVTGTTENSLNPQTDVREIDQIATEFSLSQNYPNPFNPSTVIRFSLPENDLVTLKVYDIAGSEIAALLNETKKAGAYEVSFDASRLTSGMYFYTLQTSRGSITKKMSLVK
jgi:hypothetical protein